MTWAPDYTTSAVLKSYLHIGDTADDVFIALWVTTASRNVDDFTHRQFGKVALEARTYRSKWDRRECAYVAEVDDLQDLTGLAIVAGGTTLTAAQYTLHPLNATQKGKPFERIHTSVCGDLVTTAPFGWTAIPSAVPTGMLMQAARLAARRDSPFGIAGSPSDGSEIRLLAQLDPDFRTSLKPFVRNWWAA